MKSNPATVRLECRLCGAHTVVRADAASTARCSVCGGTNLDPIPTLDPPPPH